MREYRERRAEREWETREGRHAGGRKRESCDQLLLSCLLFSYLLSDLLFLILLSFHIFSSHFFSPLFIYNAHLLVSSFLCHTFISSSLLLLPVVPFGFLQAFLPLPPTSSHFLPLCNKNLDLHYIVLFLLASSHFILYCLLFCHCLLSFGVLSSLLLSQCRILLLSFNILHILLFYIYLPLLLPTSLNFYLISCFLLFLLLHFTPFLPLSCLLSTPLLLPVILLLRFLTFSAGTSQPCALCPASDWYCNETYPNIPSSLYCSPPLVLLHSHLSS